jgi:(p)ppGpp synthase/HD superfamily hydrolase
MDLGIAIAIASGAFAEKKDKGGVPYIMHCLYVMNRMPEDDEELRCIAVLHDLLEDTEWTEQDLRDEGFSERVIRGVVAMTKEEGWTYKEYIRAKVMQNRDAVRVKLADLEHNSHITRMKGLSQKDFNRLEKYHNTYVLLKDSLNGI